MDLMDSIVLIICTTTSQELNRSRSSSSQYIELNDLIFYGQLHQRDYHIWIYVDLAKSKALESNVEMLKGAKNILNSFLG